MATVLKVLLPPRVTPSSPARVTFPLMGQEALAPPCWVREARPATDLHRALCLEFLSATSWACCSGAACYCPRHHAATVAVHTLGVLNLPRHANPWALSLLDASSPRYLGSSSLWCK
uniref:Uncharacterized protein n=1 Tax=Arundo donax TaxID=35708 RepID=A0A0A9CBC7_ARUDO